MKEKKRRVLKGVTSVSLVVALVVSLFPVPTGVPLLDKRYEDAEAVAPAVAAIAVFATALAAYGVYTAGTTQAAYQENLGTLYDGFVADSGMTQAEVDGMLTGAVNSSGNINLGLLTTSFFPLLAAYVQGLISSGEIATGVNSKSNGGDVVYIGNNAFPAVSQSEVPYTAEANSRMNAWDSEVNGDRLYAVRFSSGSDSNGQYNVTYWEFFNNSTEPKLNIVGAGTADGVNYDYGLKYTSSGRSRRYYVARTAYFDGRVNWYVSNSLATENILYPGRSLLLNDGFAYVVNGYNVSSGWLDNVLATVTSGVAANTAVVPDTVVEPFEPDAGTLEDGWDSTAVVDAVNANTGAVEGLGGYAESMDGTLADILSTIVPWETTLSSILSAMNPIAAILTGVQSLVTSVASGVTVLTGLATSPFSWLQNWWNTLTGWWSSLLAWVGATPIGTLVGNVCSSVDSGVSVLSGLASGPFAWLQGWWNSLSGWWSSLLAWVGATPIGTLIGNVCAGIDAVATGIGSLLGVNDASTWWGTLSGWWQGLLDWAGATPLGQLLGSLVGTITGSISSVVSGIQAGVGTLSALLDALLAAVDGLMAGELTFPPLQVMPEPEQLAIPVEQKSGYLVELEEKAPFAYVTAFFKQFDRVKNTYSSAESFYVDVEIPMTNEVQRFDASMVLNQELGGMRLAYLMRVGLTMLICIGILRFTYRTVVTVGR